MADFVVVGGVPIKVSPSSGKADWNDAVDRRRSFDNTYRASATGGAARDWHFSTPPITRAVAGTYRAVLSQVQAQMCSGEGLEIPTMCCAELIGETPVKGAASNYVSLDFALHESQSKRLLLKYTPGDVLSGEAFSRSTVATYFNINGVLVTAAINEKRDSFYGSYPQGTIRETYLEAPRQNQVLWASDQSNAAWTKSNMSVATGIPGMRGATSACTLTATSAVADLQQFLSAGSSIVRTNSIWMRRRTGTGQVELYAPDGTTFIVPTLTATFQRIQIPGPATTARKFEIILRTSGDAIDVENAQLEDGAFATSEIQTTTVAVTRATDSYSLPFTPPPQELSFYLKFVELGTASAVKWLASITSAANADPELVILSNGGFYAFVHRNAASTQVTSTLAAAPAIGQTVELLGRLFGDGSVDITQSINGGASTSGAQTAANALASAWSALLLWLNSDGSLANAGFSAIQSVKLVAGSRSLAEMRAA